MKNLFIRHLVIVSAFLTVVFLGSCNPSQHSGSSSNKNAVIVFCSGKAYQTNSEYIRATGTGQSKDQSLSEVKALNEARTKIATSIKSAVTAVTEKSVVSKGSGKQEEIKQEFAVITKEIVDQELKGTKVICEKVIQKNGIYTTYVAVEMQAALFLASLKSKNSADKLLKDIDMEQYQKDFLEEIEKNVSK